MVAVNGSEREKNDDGQTEMESHGHVRRKRKSWRENKEEGGKGRKKMERAKKKWM
jgi:hypothetical protein